MKNRLNIVEILLQAIYSSGGVQRYLDTEDIAQKAYQISPNSLCWKKYSDQIDLNKVKVNLYQASKKKLLSGNKKKGWMLTSKGLEATEKSRKKSSNGFQLRSLKKDIIDQDIEITRISKNPIFLNFQKEKLKPSFRQMESIFRIDSYTTPENRKIRIRKVVNLCRKNSQISDFLKKNLKILKQNKRR